MYNVFDLLVSFLDEKAKNKNFSARKLKKKVKEYIDSDLMKYYVSEELNKNELASHATIRK